MLFPVGIISLSTLVQLAVVERLRSHLNYVIP
jgi:hypothetical protein